MISDDPMRVIGNLGHRQPAIPAHRPAMIDDDAGQG
jgi:hypothetical protein